MGGQWVGGCAVGVQWVWVGGEWAVAVTVVFSGHSNGQWCSDDKWVCLLAVVGCLAGWLVALLWLWLWRWLGGCGCVWLAGHSW